MFIIFLNRLQYLEQSNILSAYNKYYKTNKIKSKLEEKKLDKKKEKQARTHLSFIYICFWLAADPNEETQFKVTAPKY